ncbi:hypothetical protein ASD24_02720 [Paenibacillus sp. Root52]|uniref:DUF2750 domain-containing protein n=1 Tax=Paenibacillus amylolyticus TaxID=1451 RepID=A0AAP5LMP2_PAEAM|nr:MULTISPECIES: DUF2750 domain-containing protein [Paenibacillus]KQY94487.1 hypothetical protein ASD24_02720 [Paenibacillus sp. Root52]MDR6724431.1 hypothetical protein [Paenibacillus amylolyticus]
MNQKEFESVINLPANIRYEYFIKKVVDSEEVWGLYENGWSVTEDDKGNKLVPFWPKKEFAEYCASDDWGIYSTKRINLTEFINEFLPNFKKEGFLPSIFFNNADSALLDVDILIEDLKTELEKY